MVNKKFIGIYLWVTLVGRERVQARPTVVHQRANTDREGSIVGRLFLEYLLLVETLQRFIGQAYAYNLPTLGQ